MSMDDDDTDVVTVSQDQEEDVDSEVSKKTQRMSLSIPKYNPSVIETSKYSEWAKLLHSAALTLEGFSFVYFNKLNLR